MKKITIIILFFIVAIATLFLYLNQTKEVTKTTLVLYVQNKEEAQNRDCGITQRKVVEVPQTPAVADASLRILFEDELSKYGIYDSVSINNKVAKVMLKSENTPIGTPISSLSSCESSHLRSVLEDTLTQYETIDRVELFSPRGKIDF